MRCFVLVFLLLSFSQQLNAQMAWSYLEVIYSDTGKGKYARFMESDIDSDACFSGADQSNDANECLAFKMPLRLVGRTQNEIVLKGQRSPGSRLYTLSGDNADAACIGTGYSTSCLIEFKNLNISREATDDYLKSVIHDEGELRKSLYLAERFARTPVLRYWHGIH